MKTFVKYFFGGLLFVAALALPLTIGQGTISWQDLFGRHTSMMQEIVWNIRLPRIIFAFLVGASLSLVGAAFQVLLRNELATPYTLGISSGGALGAVIAIKTGLVIYVLGFSSSVVFSIAGSLLTVGIIFFIACERYEISTFTLLLAGVTIGLFFSAMILFIHYLADFTETYRMIRWLMGALDVVGWRYPLAVLIIFIPVFIYLFLNASAFNLLLSGSEIARSRGVDVRSLQKWSFIASSILVGTCVSMAGPIGFIGLIVPHVVRLIFGPDHRKLFVLVILLGGVFLVWADTVARTIIAPAELPVGIITSLIGGPFFIYLLVRNKVGR